MFLTVIRRLSPLIIFLIFIALATLLLNYPQKITKSSAPLPLPNVDIFITEPSDITLDIDSYGLVEPKQKIHLVAEVKGRIIKISPEFAVGNIVNQGQQLAVIEPADYQTELLQAQASLAQAQASLEQELARAKVAQVEFNDFAQGKAPELGLRKPQLKKEQAHVQFAQAALERAKRNLNRTIIRAPFKGIIRDKSIDVGQYVTIGSQLGEIYNTNTAIIRLPIEQQKLAFLDWQQKPKVSVKLDNDDNKIWYGDIVRSEGIINDKNRMLYLVAEINDPYQQNSDHFDASVLNFGTFINAKIIGKKVTDTIKLPRYLLKNNSLVIASKENRLARLSVKILYKNTDFVFLENNQTLQSAKVIASKVNLLETGQQVQIRQTLPLDNYPINHTLNSAVAY